MSDNVDVVDLVSNLLDSGKYKEVLSVHNEEKYASSFKDNCWDMISVAVSKIQDETIVIKPSLHSACEELLSIIVQKATPEEALLEFIEQVEVAKNDAQFGIVLTPLQQLLKKLSAKRGRSLEWCLNSISTYIENIPIPEFQLEGKERLLAECDSNIRRIIRVYSLVIPFYQPFIEELKTPESNPRTKQIIAAFLISLLGKPLIYLDLDIDNNQKSEARLCCNTIVKDICSLEKNILKFLQYVEICNKDNHRSKVKSSESDEEMSPYDHKEKLNMLSLSGLYYVVLSSQFELPDSAMPQVYAAEYIVHTGMLCVIYLLSCPGYGPQSKALTLCEALLKRLSKNASASLLSASVHFHLCKALINIAIYAQYDTLRKHAVNAICHHIHSFEYSGRCMLIKYIIATSNHSGMIGYAITLLKNSINDAFNESELPACFTNPQLLDLIKKVCHLPHGAESDLMELSDQIISALNFLRYLVIRDTANKTGIKECYAYIESEYLSNLRTALNMSKAHYEVKLKDIEEGKDISEGVNISINVGGNPLDAIPDENKKEIIQSALNAFHLMEGLVARLSESIRNGRRFILPLATVPVQNAQRQIRYYSEQYAEREIKTPATTVTTEHEENQYEESIKNRILEKALQFVTKNGWSVKSLSAGAEAAGYPGVAHGLFPNGGGDLVHYFNVKCNEELVEQMKTNEVPYRTLLHTPEEFWRMRSEMEIFDHDTDTDMKDFKKYYFRGCMNIIYNWPKDQVHESKVPAKFIENAIMTRLLMIEPYKSTWPKAMAIQALPNNVPNCLATLLSLVDDICYHSGDRSVDFNWYIRRVGLAGIYKASELFYLTDSSPNNDATRSFITSRIRDAELLQSALSLNPVAATPQTLSAAFVTAKNVLGMNPLK